MEFKESSIALSSLEAEHIATTFRAYEIIWLRGILEDMQQHQEKPTIISIMIIIPQFL